MNKSTQHSRLATDNHLVGSDSVAFDADDEIREVASLPVAIQKSQRLFSL